MTRGRCAKTDSVYKGKGGSQGDRVSTAGFKKDGACVRSKSGGERDQKNLTRDYDLLEVDIHVTCICVGTEIGLRRALGQYLDRLPTLEAPVVTITIKESE
jgi:hypothetical protein